jgi:sorbitol/mannitol transport system permease protein
MDGAPRAARFWFITLPHLSRAITIVILIQTIFLLSIFAEIFVTTGGAFGTRTLTYLIYQRVLESQNVGLGSAGGVYAIILANIVALFLMRIVGKNLDGEGQTWHAPSPHAARSSTPPPPGRSGC